MLSFCASLKKHNVVAFRIVDDRPVSFGLHQPILTNGADRCFEIGNFKEEHGLVGVSGHAVEIEAGLVRGAKALHRHHGAKGAGRKVPHQPGRHEVHGECIDAHFYAIVGSVGIITVHRYLRGCQAE